MRNEEIDNCIFKAIYRQLQVYQCSQSSQRHVNVFMGEQANETGKGGWLQRFDMLFQTQQTPDSQKNSRLVPSEALQRIKYVRHCRPSNLYHDLSPQLQLFARPGQPVGGILADAFCNGAQVSNSIWILLVITDKQANGPAKSFTRYQSQVRVHVKVHNASNRLHGRNVTKFTHSIHHYHASVERTVIEQILDFWHVQQKS
mmetsp:Transcript_46628/g.82740  ORF Transcript_46628/g.82740 Transcript_46628/m.82740 type:complete len:201 (+) Transcript_46628:94-696(+)